jgi:hypothetical protein
MNLHQVAAPLIGAVNPFFGVRLKISMGASVNGDGTETPGYETPGEIIGSITGTVLTVATIGVGRPSVGQTLRDRSGALAPGTLITGLLSGDGRQPGSQWSVSPSQTVPEEAMTTYLRLQAQIQPITWKDVQMMDGLNIEGVRWKAFLNGQLDGLVRGERKGGDLLVVPRGHRHAGQWLVAQVLEQWPNWVSAAITLQNSVTDED